MPAALLRAEKWSVLVDDFRTFDASWIGFGDLSAFRLITWTQRGQQANPERGGGADILIDCTRNHFAMAAVSRADAANPLLPIT